MLRLPTTSFTNAKPSAALVKNTRPGVVSTSTCRPRRARRPPQRGRVQHRTRSGPQRDRHLQPHVAGLEGGLDLVDVAEDRPAPTPSSTRRVRYSTEDHVLGGHLDRAPLAERGCCWPTASRPWPRLGFGDTEVACHLVTSKSALKAVQTSGGPEWPCLDEDGLERLIPSRCNVGARSAAPGCSRITPPTRPHLGRRRSTGLADLISAPARRRPAAHHEGLEGSSAMSLGRAALVRLRFGRSR